MFNQSEVPPSVQAHSEGAEEYTNCISAEGYDPQQVALSAGAVKYTDCISAEVFDSPSKCTG